MRFRIAKTGIEWRSTLQVSNFKRHVRVFPSRLEFSSHFFHVGAFLLDFQSLENPKQRPRVARVDEQPDNEIPSLLTEYGRKLVEEALGDAEVLVLDSISTLFNFATNEEEPWLEVMAWLKKLRSKGLCIIFLHHAGKQGIQRGSSKSEDLLDVSIKLAQPEDYSHRRRIASQPDL